MPAHHRADDVVLLPLLHSAAKENHQLVSVFAEVDSITWTEIDAVLKHAAADSLDVGKIALRHPRLSTSYLGGCLCVQSTEPNRKRTLPGPV